MGLREPKPRLLAFGLLALSCAIQTSTQDLAFLQGCRQRLRPEGYYDYMAADLPPDTPYPGETVDSCTIRCANTPHCGGFVWQSDGNCWLKNEDIGTDSGEWRDDNITHSEAWGMQSCFAQPQPGASPPPQISSPGPLLAPPPPPESTTPLPSPQAPGESGSSSSGSSSSGSSTGPIIGAVVGGVILLLVAVIAAAFLVRRKRTNRGAPPTAEHLGPVLPLVHDSRPPDGSSKGGHLAPDSMSSNYATTTPMLHSAAASSTWNGPSGMSSGPPAAALDVTQKRALLSDQLDDLTRRRDLLCGRFLLLSGPSQRIASGQGVVQFAKHAFQEKQFAIKFYLDERAFEVERDHFCNHALDDIRPDIEGVEANKGDHAIRVLGHRLPPMVIIEKGQSLDIYAKRAHPNEHACISIMLDLLDRFIAMHDAGLVHRDIKPANVIWYETRNEWRVIDFGAACEIGAEVSMACTLAYAAPETLKALAEGRKTVIADPAVDVWALAVVAFELRTRTQVFAPGQLTRDNAWQVMCQKLPWEQVDSPDYKANMKSLGFMKNGILSMLKRNPQERSTLHEVRAMWRQTLNPSTTMVTSAALYR